MPGACAIETRQRRDNNDRRVVEVINHGIYNLQEEDEVKRGLRERETVL